MTKFFVISGPIKWWNAAFNWVARPVLIYMKSKETIDLTNFICYTWQYKSNFLSFSIYIPLLLSYFFKAEMCFGFLDSFLLPKTSWLSSAVDELLPRPFVNKNLRQSQKCSKISSRYRLFKTPFQVLDQMALPSIKDYWEFKNNSLIKLLWTID